MAHATYGRHKTTFLSYESGGFCCGCEVAADLHSAWNCADSIQSPQAWPQPAPEN